MPRYKHLLAHHVEAHASQTWSHNMSVLQQQIGPPPLLVEVGVGCGNVVKDGKEGGAAALGPIEAKTLVRDISGLEKAK